MNDVRLMDLFETLDHVPAHPPRKKPLSRGAKDALARKRVERASNPNINALDGLPSGMCLGGECPIFPTDDEVELLCEPCRRGWDRAHAPSQMRTLNTGQPVRLRHHGSQA